MTIMSFLFISIYLFIYLFIYLKNLLFLLYGCRINMPFSKEAWILGVETSRQKVLRVYFLSSS
jgi:hypothetical protein